MKPDIVSSTLLKIVNQRHLRKLLVKKLDDYVYKHVVNNNSEDLKEVRLRMYLYLSAMLHCVVRNVDKGYISKEVMKKIIDVFVQNSLIGGDQSYEQAKI
ncbi:hypothetical protein ES703_59936 [subsurface metagenome]